MAKRRKKRGSSKRRRGYIGSALHKHNLKRKKGRKGSKRRKGSKGRKGHKKLSKAQRRRIAIKNLAKARRARKKGKRRAKHGGKYFRKSHARRNHLGKRARRLARIALAVEAANKRGSRVSPKQERALANVAHQSSYLAGLRAKYNANKEADVNRFS